MAPSSEKKPEIRIPTIASKNHMRIKILHILWSAKRGGSGNLVLGILKNLDREKYDVTVCFLGASGPLRNEFKKAGIRVKFIDTNPRSSAKKVVLFCRFLGNSYLDIIHDHLRNPWVALCLSLYQKPVPKIVTEHFLADEASVFHTAASRKLRIFYKLFAHNYKRVIAVSRPTYNALDNMVGLPSSRIVYIPNGIEIERFSQARCDISKKKKQIGISSPTYVVGGIGHLERFKDFDLFIDTAREILKMQNNVEFIIVGDGSLKAQLVEKVRSNSMDTKVHFLGVRGDIPELLKIMDVFLLTSITESFGIVTLESMAAGTPVVSVRVGGVTDYILNGETGILASQRDPIVLAKEVVKLLNDYEKRKHISTKAMAIASQFDIKDVALQYAEIYDRLLNTA